MYLKRTVDDSEPVESNQQVFFKDVLPTNIVVAQQK